MCRLFFAYNKIKEGTKFSGRYFCSCELISSFFLLHYRAAHCLPKTTGKESIRGVFDWPLTVIGRKSSSVKCPYGPQAAGATRPCGGNFRTGGVWGNPDVDNCKYKSERTNQLDSLAKVGDVTCPLKNVLS